ncbi:hypothetical protein LEL_10785 [Akanthomyces lecanii RCEF 1005]|uniref:Uncharacterized protein n=1 Tax=Akanthomyces lecanii RCEF 1005 TaxID=1081108 RepID=A0A167THD2_CORDF|nr:hypothetical protein LEL_10785 [Akanthomyces lecanii RCEF 1005]
MPSETNQAIAELLERYLVVYTTLRAALTAAQQRMFHALARANFTADRGVRHYGQNQYGERIQASRRVTISAPTSASLSPPTFTIAEEPAAAEEEEAEQGEEEEKNKKKEKHRQQQALTHAILLHGYEKIPQKKSYHITYSNVMTHL